MIRIGFFILLILPLLTAAQRRPKSINMCKLAHKKWWYEEKVIVKGAPGQIQFEHILTHNVYDGGKYILTVHLFDTTNLKKQPIVNLADTVLVKADFSPINDASLHYLEQYKISGTINFISFNKNKIIAVLDIVVLELKSQDKYVYKSRVKFIDYSPWN